jgi:RNA-directed DNA polymerase
VVETDIANCFEAIPHAGLMQAIEERVGDRAVLGLVRTLLRAGVMQGGSLRRGVAGTPQGGVVSPLLANVYLHRLDRAWQAREHGVLVRYADDALVLCTTREQAEAALGRLCDLLAELGLGPKAAKTRIVHLVEGGEGFDFLGFHHRLVRGRTPRSVHLAFLARWPSRKAIQRARDRIREITGRKRLLVPVEDIVGSSTASCAAGLGTSATETPPGSSARSGTTPCAGSRCCCPRRASDGGPGTGACARCCDHPTTWA